MYREWAPAATDAQLIGDFNEWNGTPLKKDDFGVWSVSLPDVNGRPVIAHKSRVKVRLTHQDGWTIDLVPAWISYAVMPPGMGATFDGVHWSPPREQKFQWCAPACALLLCCRLFRRVSLFVAERRVPHGVSASTWLCGRDALPVP